jgi:hypothetical protein
MQHLRSIHLYLGCLFASFGVRRGIRDLAAGRRDVVRVEEMTTIHTHVPDVAAVAAARQWLPDWRDCR